MSSELPILALDIGLKRTGVAISESGLVATPLTTIEWEAHPEQLVNAVIALVKEYAVKIVVAGVPSNEDGSNTGQAEKTLTLIEKIRSALGEVPVIEQSEFHTSQDALELFPGVQRDAAAAAVILQQYLEEVS